MLVCSPARGNYKHNTNQPLIGRRGAFCKHPSQRANAPLWEEVVCSGLKESLNRCAAPHLQTSSLHNLMKEQQHSFLLCGHQLRESLKVATKFFKSCNYVFGSFLNQSILVVCHHRHFQTGSLYHFPFQGLHHSIWLLCAAGALYHILLLKYSRAAGLCPFLQSLAPGNRQVKAAQVRNYALT